MLEGGITNQELLDAYKKAINKCRGYAAMADDAATKTQFEIMGIALETAMERFKEPEPIELEVNYGYYSTNTNLGGESRYVSHE